MQGHASHLPRSSLWTSSISAYCSATCAWKASKRASRAARLDSRAARACSVVLCRRAEGGSEVWVQGRGQGLSPLQGRRGREQGVWVWAKAQVLVWVWGCLLCRDTEAGCKDVGAGHAYCGAAGKCTSKSSRGARVCTGSGPDQAEGWGRASTQRVPFDALCVCCGGHVRRLAHDGGPCKLFSGFSHKGVSHMGGWRPGWAMAATRRAWPEGGRAAKRLAPKR